MNPDLEVFLEEALESIQPSSDSIGRVVVEPDYEADGMPSSGEQLARELVELLRSASPQQAALGSPHGYEVEIPSRYPLLAKYIQRITLHQNRVEGPWVEVAPPGNWI